MTHFCTFVVVKFYYRILYNRKRKKLQLKEIIEKKTLKKDLQIN